MTLTLNIVNTFFFFLHGTATHDNTPQHQVWLKMVSSSGDVVRTKIGHTDRITVGQTDTRTKRFQYTHTPNLPYLFIRAGWGGGL